jgi:hypothetical protein
MRRTVGLMGEKYAGTTMAKYFIASDREKDVLTPAGT